MCTEKVAILMATYQGEKYIRQQIDSLLGQTYGRWTAYIHDDGSTDNTKFILEEYSNKYPDKFVIIEGESCGGAKNNFLYLMKQVIEPYIMFCDQDDVWDDDKIQVSIDAIKDLERKHREVVPCLLFSDLKVVDENLNIIADSMTEFQKLDCKSLRTIDIANQNVVTGCTTIINKATLEMSNRYIDSSKIIMHDWWCAMVAAEFGEISYIDRPLIKYRQHSSNSVGAKDANSPGYVMSKLKRIYDIKESIKHTRLQAEEFSRVYELTEENPVYLLSTCGEKSRNQRRKFYKEYNVSKTGFFRKIGFWIFG